MSDYNDLKKYCTDRQWEIFQAVEEHGSNRKAAIALSVHSSSVDRAIAAVKKKAARRGWSPEHDLTMEVPDGFHLRGASTLYGPDGERKLQWVKSNIDHERQRQIFMEMVEELAQDLPRLPPISAPEHDIRDMLCVYPVGDHHMGMLSWGIETGQSYDLKIGEKMLSGASDYLFNTMPNASHALIAVLGDFFHYDSFEAVTPTSRNHLDADSRYPKMVRAGIRSLRRMIEAAAEKHGQVHVIIEIGNHDLSTSVFLMECLHNVYMDNDRVTIDTSPMHYHYYRFGSTLIGTHHGHGAKMQQLPLIMAADRPQDWGDTDYRYWYTGHVHHSKTQAAVSGQDYTGCRVESFRVLAPMDAYAHQKGYRSMQDMKGLVITKDAGEVARHTVNPRMLGFT
jgi:hypothetical protein